MAEAPWDVIIVGQGLAGTTLAWHLREAGQRVLVIDACEPVTSSKIAAGLITPITGQRVSTLVSEDKEAGHYELTWNGAEVANGIYVYRLEAGDFVAAKRMVIVR